VRSTAEGEQPARNHAGGSNLSRTWPTPCDSIIEYAKSSITIDNRRSRRWAGIREPFVAKPRNMDEAKQNMRVEFRLVRADGEAAKPSDFDFSARRP
jgi:hypothetical protein